jgi:cystathionine gamma-lyase
MASHGFGTIAVHAGQSPDQWNHGAVIPPVCMSSTFHQSSPGQPTKFAYSRCGNPTRDCLETALAALEGAKYGLAFSSGLAAQLTIIQTLVKSGEHIVCCEDCYGGAGEQLRTNFANLGVETTFFEGTNEQNIVDAIIPGRTKIVWIETPTNPCLNLFDLKAVNLAIRKIDPKIVLVVDNTFMSSYLQQPMTFGADIVMHSLSKFMNGHSDVVMGAAMTDSEEIYKKLLYFQESKFLILEMNCNNVGN